MILFFFHLFFDDWVTKAIFNSVIAMWNLSYTAKSWLWGMPKWCNNSKQTRICWFVLSQQVQDIFGTSIAIAPCRGGEKKDDVAWQRAINFGQDLFFLQNGKTIYQNLILFVVVQCGNDVSKFSRNTLLFLGYILFSKHTIITGVIRWKVLVTILMTPKLNSVLVPILSNYYFIIIVI